MTKNVLTIEAFADWCEKQPAELTYPYANHHRCACGQYAQHVGLFPDWRHTERPFWVYIDHIAFQRPRTFGALAKRLRSA